MTAIRESIGLVVVGLLIVGLLGLAGFSFYGLLHAEEVSYAPAKTLATTDGGEASLARSETENSDWKKAAQKLENRLALLEREARMPERIARDASSSVALVIGEYIWTDRRGRRPLRYQGLDDSGAPLTDAKGQELVAFDGQGPIVVRDFTGTGFLLNSGKVLTSGFVLNPWYEDPLLDESEEPERIPSIRFLHAYFPGYTTAVDLKIDHAQEDTQTVLCLIEGGRIDAPGLELSKTSVEAGQAIISIGYPGGVPMLASRISDDAKRELFKFGSSNSDELAGWLASHRLIQPIVMQARITALTDGKIFYDTLATLGSTGSPILNSQGKVAGMSEAINNNFPSLNRAWPVSRFQSWLDGLARAIK